MLAFKPSTSLPRYIKLQRFGIKKGLMERFTTLKKNRIYSNRQTLGGLNRKENLMKSIWKATWKHTDKKASWQSLQISDSTVTNIQLCPVESMAKEDPWMTLSTSCRRELIDHFVTISVSHTAHVYKPMGIIATIIAVRMNVLSDFFG